MWTKSGVLNWGWECEDKEEEKEEEGRGCRTGQDVNPPSATILLEAMQTNPQLTVRKLLVTISPKKIATTFKILDVTRPTLRHKHVHKVLEQD